MLILANVITRIYGISLIDIACTEREMIEIVFQYGDIHEQFLYLTRYSGFYSNSHYQWYDERGREEGYKGKGERDKARV